MPGLRERKKQQTRDAIVRAAMALFRERGYEATTVVDIAEAADIAPRTFFAYFETKEAVVFHDFDAVLARFDARLANRRDGESTIDALRGWVVQWLADGPPRAEEHEEHRALVRSTPALQARELANRAAFEAVIGENVAADLGVPASSLRPRLVGAAAVAALTALDHPTTVADPMAIVDEALAFLQGGLDVLRGRPAPDV